MRAMTETNLKDAFAGESQAHMKYLAFAAKAEQEGYPKVGLLFKAIAFAEQVHAINHFKELGGIGDTSSNLAAAFGGENFEVEEMYPAYQVVAELQEEKGAQRSIRFALEAEKIHEDMYREAKTLIDAGKDIDVTKVSICPVCGHTVFGDPEERCTVCNIPPEKYLGFEA